MMTNNEDADCIANSPKQKMIREPIEINAP